MAPKLYTIPPSAAFLTTLVERLLDGTLVPGFAPGADPLALSRATIYLPTRRAGRALREAFREAFGGKAALLPHIRPLGGVDETELLLNAAPDLDPLAPAMGELERRIAMTRLILAWAGHLRRHVLKLGADEPFAVPASPADATWLAADLLSLMDQMETEEADWRDIRALVPDDYSKYWQITLDFLKIATEAWPAHLAEQGRMDPNHRRSALVRREADALMARPPAGPVIVAGSTGSVPATADLIKAVAELPMGAVVLPGLDMAMEDTVWRSLTGDTPAPSHPQYGLARLLAHLGAARDDVTELAEPASNALADRGHIVGEALRPAQTTDVWRRFLAGPVAARAPEAFGDVSLVTARNEAEEALAIAASLRAAVESGKEAALVTPDRMLARRVAGELRRWNLAVDDSAGQPLARTPPAVLTRLATAAALGGLDPVTLLALLKHPLARFGLSAAQARSAARALERAVLRGPKPRHGTRGLIDALNTAEGDLANARHVPRWRRLATAEWAAARDLCERLARALEPLESLFGNVGLVSVETLAERTIACLKAVAVDENGTDLALFSGEAGEVLAQALTGIVEAQAAGLAIPAGDWPGVFEALISALAVHVRTPGDPRIHIWGTLEARLQRPDLLILAGLNEGTWPATSRNDPWLNRPMKRDIGLEPPERRIGLAAHDFAQGLGANMVVLSRAQRAGTAPTVASRWLQRLLTIAGSQAADQMHARGNEVIAWARALDASEGVARPAPRPNPKPPIETRPRRISVTAVETWVRDPYAIFARSILKLDPVEPLGGLPGAAERGNIVHDTLADFIEEWHGPLDDTARARLIEIGEAKFSHVAAFPEIHALWWPRFLRIADWFVGKYEAERAAITRQRHVELSGLLELAGPAGVFALSGRADRIDMREDGTLSILDYKTGTPPSKKEVASLFAPQLALEAAMVAKGVFREFPPGLPVGEIAYVRLSGGSPAGMHCARKPKDVEIADLAADALARLDGLIAAYDNPDQGYLSRARPKFENRMDGDYDHLARVREWSLGSEEDA